MTLRTHRYLNLQVLPPQTTVLQTRCVCYYIWRSDKVIPFMAKGYFSMDILNSHLIQFKTYSFFFSKILCRHLTFSCLLQYSLLCLKTANSLRRFLKVTWLHKLRMTGIKLWVSWPTKSQNYCNTFRSCQRLQAKLVRPVDITTIIILNNIWPYFIYYKFYWYFVLIFLYQFETYQSWPCH